MVLAFVSNPDNSIPISEDEVSEAEMPPNEEEIGSLEENPISFGLSGPNKELSRSSQLDDDPASSGDSIMHSPHPKPMRQPTCKEKGKMKMSEYGTNVGFSDRSESQTTRCRAY